METLAKVYTNFKKKKGNNKNSHEEPHTGRGVAFGSCEQRDRHVRKL